MPPQSRAPRFTRLDPESLAALVGAFYASARRDTLLGPVFTAAVGQSDAEWEAHLDRVHAFWCSVALGAGDYQGRPMQAHAFLPGLEAVHFRRWLELFAAACNALFPPHIADGLMEKARRMANAFQAGIALSRAGGIAGLDMPSDDPRPDRAGEPP